jgi:excinuclease ABC subunit B
MGRAARNAHGQVIMYADRMTDSMEAAITITQERRARQIAYNAENGIVPVTVKRAMSDLLDVLRPSTGGALPTKGRRDRKRDKDNSVDLAKMGQSDLTRLVETLRAEMNQAAIELQFEYAARLRDEVKDIEAELARR